jgi:hypothetical protein
MVLSEYSYPISPLISLSITNHSAFHIFPED